MNPHTWIVRGCAMALLMLVSAAAGDAAGTIHRTAYLTFRQPVGLPGIALAAGTYRFELAAPGGSPSVVRVSSRDGRLVHYMGFTISVPRRKALSGASMVTLGEAPEGTPQPIEVWFPPDTAEGRRFLYR
jgi:hypothetical protein